MSRILRMNRRHIPELSVNKTRPSQLLEILLFTGFCAEINLHDVLEALRQKDHSDLAKASERNAKLARLRGEIEERVAMETIKPIVGDRLSQKLLLTPTIAIVFEKMGTKTVELAALCDQLIHHSKPSRTAEIKKLIEHAIYMTDSAAAAFVYDELPWAKGAIEEGRAAAALYERITRELACLRETEGNASTRVHLLEHIASKTNEIIEETKQMAAQVISCLDNSKVRA